MIIKYTVGSRAGRVTEVDDVTGRWMVDKRRAVEVAPEPPEQGVEVPRVKRKYTRRAPVDQAPVEGVSEGGSEEG